jgi:aminopeptidase C
MKAKRIKSIELENEMQLNFYDASVKLAGDRWLVSLIVRMEIPVKKVLIRDSVQSSEQVSEIEKVLGKNIRFEQKRERIFIDETKKEDVFKELCDNFLSNTFRYLSKKEFPKQYVLKKYREKKLKDSWYH